MFPFIDDTTPRPPNLQAAPATASQYATDISNGTNNDFYDTLGPNGNGMPSNAGYALGTNGYFDEVTYDTDSATAPPGSTGSDDTQFDISGDWSWGNDSNIGLPSNAKEHDANNYVANIYYTFPTPAGKTVSITIHVVDGDHCGDYDNTTMVFSNTTGVGGASGQSVELVQ